MFRVYVLSLYYVLVVCKIVYHNIFQFLIFNLFFVSHEFFEITLETPNSLPKYVPLFYRVVFQSRYYFSHSFGNLFGACNTIVTIYCRVTFSILIIPHKYLWAHIWLKKSGPLPDSEVRAQTISSPDAAHQRSKK